MVMMMMMAYPRRRRRRHPVITTGTVTLSWVVQTIVYRNLNECNWMITLSLTYLIVETKRIWTSNRGYIQWNIVENATRRQFSDWHERHLVNLSVRQPTEMSGTQILCVHACIGEFLINRNILWKLLKCFALSSVEVLCEETICVDIDRAFNSQSTQNNLHSNFRWTVLSCRVLTKVVKFFHKIIFYDLEKY